MSGNEIKNISTIQKKAWNKVKQTYGVTDAALLKFNEHEGWTTFTVYNGGAAFLEISVRHADDLIV